MRNGKTEEIWQFLIVLAMLILTTVLNIFLEYLIQPSSLVFVYLVPAIAGAIYFGTWASVLSFIAGFHIMACLLAGELSLILPLPKDYFCLGGFLMILFQIRLSFGVAPIEPK